MVHPRGENLAIVSTVLLCAAAMGLFLLPERQTNLVKSTVADVVAPVQTVARDWIVDLKSRGQSGKFGAEEAAQLARLKEELATWQDRCAKLQVQTALLREQIHTVQREGISPYQSAASAPLFVPQLIETRVLARETADRWQAGTLLRGGKNEGIQPALFVLEAAPNGIANDVLLDQGTGEQIAPGMPVYAGRRVVGKIRRVGRWVSTVQPITDTEFRAHAQLGRNTPRGLLLGAEGVLEGRGDELCRLKFVPASEAVAEGDEVFTGRRDGALPYPLQYGTVVKAELTPGKPHWDIWVRPATTSKLERRTLHVLRTTLNPDRQLAN